MPPPPRAGAPVVLTDENFQAVLDSKQPVLVDFWAARCTPCLTMKPAIQALVKEFAGRATISELDVDANPLTPKKYEIDRLPTVLIFSNGNVVKQFDHLQTRDKMARALNAVTAPAESNPDQGP